MIDRLKAVGFLLLMIIEIICFPLFVIDCLQWVFTGTFAFNYFGEAFIDYSE